MKHLFTVLCLVSCLAVSTSSFSQVKSKGATTNLVLPPPTDPGDGGGGGGYTPPPVYGHYVANGNAGSTFSGYQITLFEGNNATQDIIANGRISNANLYGTSSGRFRLDAFTVFSNVFLFNNELEQYSGLPANDEARSLRMNGMAAGRILQFFDNGEAHLDDDWVEILVKTTIPTTAYYQIDSFEHSFEDQYVKVTYHSDNGLDGKISYCRTYMSSY